jgi:general secretion pathway protein C
MKLNWIKYLNFVLSIVVVFLLVNTFFFLKSYGKEQEEENIIPISSVSPAFSTPKKRLSDYAVIYRRDLFNMKEAPKPMSGQKPVSLKLKGTVVGVEEFTFCIIEDRTKRQENLYQKGDKINGMEITDIMVNSVVLDNGSMVLYIEEEGVAKGEVASAPAIPERTLSDLIDIEQTSHNEWAIDRDDLLSAANNVSQILSDFKIRPNFSSGKMEGFKVDSIKSDSIALAAGMREGDIVRKVNGETIDSPKKVFDFYRNLDNSDVIQLEVERDGSTEVLTYKIK